MTKRLILGVTLALAAILAASVLLMGCRQSRSEAVVLEIVQLSNLNDYLSESCVDSDMDKPGTAWYLPADFAANRPVILSKVQLEADRLKALLDSRERISDDDRKLLQRGLRALERLTEVLGNREADIQSQKFLESLIEPISVLGLVLTNLGAHDSEYGEFRAASPQCDWENEQDF